MDEKKEDRFKAYEGSVLDQRHGVVGKRVMRDRTIKIGANGSSEYDGRWSAYGGVCGSGREYRLCSRCG